MGWKRILELILELLQFITKQWEKKEAKEEAENAQKEQDKIDNNPASWFDEHFNGVRDQETDKGANSNKAETSKHQAN